MGEGCVNISVRGWGSYIRINKNSELSHESYLI